MNCTCMIMVWRLREFASRAIAMVMWVLVCSLATHGLILYLHFSIYP